MKTTEVFVEQVLIGFLVMLIGVMIFWETIWGKVQHELGTQEGGLKFDQIDKLVVSAATIGVAYLVGIIYDRCADTLLQDIEQHNRLGFTLRIKDKPAPPEDPFPESKLRIKILDADSDISSYAEYLRSRIRLSRSLATLIPGLSAAYLLMNIKKEGLYYLWHGVAIMIPVIYGFALIAQIMKWRGYVPPKTDELSEYEKWIKERGFNFENDKTNITQGCIKKKLSQDKELFMWWISLAYREPVFWGIIVLTALEVAIGIQSREYFLLLVVLLVGTSLTLLAGWTWWRISHTFMKLLYGYNKVDPNPSNNSPTTPTNK